MFAHQLVDFNFFAMFSKRMDFLASWGNLVYPAKGKIGKKR